MEYNSWQGDIGLKLCIHERAAYALRHSRAACIKPAIHYSRTWRIGDEIIFSPNKILLVKTIRTCCCTLFVVCCQFSCGRRFFFLRKKILCSSTRPLPWHKSCVQRTAKTCSQNMANAFYILFAVCRFFIISPLFRCYLRIVYSGL